MSTNSTQVNFLWECYDVFACVCSNSRLILWQHLHCESCSSIHLVGVCVSTLLSEGVSQFFTIHVKMWLELSLIWSGENWNWKERVETRRRLKIFRANTSNLRTLKTSQLRRLVLNACKEKKYLTAETLFLWKKETALNFTVHCVFLFDIENALFGNTSTVKINVSSVFSFHSLEYLEIGGREFGA